MEHPSESVPQPGFDARLSGPGRVKPRIHEAMDKRLRKAGMNLILLFLRIRRLPEVSKMKGGVNFIFKINHERRSVILENILALIVADENESVRSPLIEFA